MSHVGELSCPIDILCTDNEKIYIKSKKDMSKCKSHNCYKLQTKGFEDAQIFIENIFYKNKNVECCDIESCNYTIKKIYRCDDCGNIIQFRFNPHIILKKGGYKKCVECKKYFDRVYVTGHIDKNRKLYYCHRCNPDFK